jgi:hypothetical protein
MKKMIGVAVLCAALLVPAGAQAHSPHDGMRYCGVSPSGTFQIRAPKATTSCPFAWATMRSVKRHQSYNGGLSYGERFRVRAYSWVTHRSYAMRCAVGRYLPAKVVCRAGNGAVVTMVAAG